MVDLNNILTVREAAALLRISPTHLYLLHNRGQGPRALRIGRAIRYTPADLSDWLLARAA